MKKMHTPHPREACYFGIKWVNHSIFPFPLFLERQVPVPAHRAGNGHAVSSHTALGSRPLGSIAAPCHPWGFPWCKAHPQGLTGLPWPWAPSLFSCSSITGTWEMQRDLLLPQMSCGVGAGSGPGCRKELTSITASPGHLLSRGTTGCNPNAGRRGAGVALGHLQPQGARPERQQGEAFPSPPSSLSFPKVPAA